MTWEIRLGKELEIRGRGGRKIKKKKNKCTIDIEIQSSFTYTLRSPTPNIAGTWCAGHCPGFQPPRWRAAGVCIGWWRMPGELLLVTMGAVERMYVCVCIYVSIYICVCIWDLRMSCSYNRHGMLAHAPPTLFAFSPFPPAPSRESHRNSICLDLERPHKQSACQLQGSSRPCSVHLLVPDGFFRSLYGRLWPECVRVGLARPAFQVFPPWVANYIYIYLKVYNMYINIYIIYIYIFIYIPVLHKNGNYR